MGMEEKGHNLGVCLLLYNGRGLSPLLQVGGGAVHFYIIVGASSPFLYNGRVCLLLLQFGGHTQNIWGEPPNLHPNSTAPEIWGSSLPLLQGFGVTPLTSNFLTPFRGPPGLNDWEDDEILASVLAVSQQEYLETMKTSRHRDPPGDKS